MLRTPKFKAFGDLQDTTAQPESSLDTDGSPFELGASPAGDWAASTAAVSGAGVALQVVTASDSATPTVVSDSGSSGPFDNISFAVNADAARQQFGVNGAGITIGIISTGFSSMAVNNGGDFSKAVADGLVDPNAVDAHDDNLSKSDEGLAMAEIVHEIAPAAHIVFYTGLPTSAGSGENAMAAAVNVLSTPKGQTVANGLPGAGQQGQGCNIVCDDIFNLSEPFYQPGDLLDQAIDKAVTNGVAYLTLAANAGPTSFYATQGAGAVNFNQSITFTLNNVTQTYSAYNFGSANNPNAFELVSIPGPASAPAGVGLDWEQPWQSISGGNGAQYILQYLLFSDNNGQPGSLLFWGAGDGSNDAMQFGGASAGSYFLAIVVTSTYGSHSGNGSVGNPGNAANIPSNENQFKIIFDNNNGPGNATIESASGQADPNAGVGSGTVWGHSEDPNAITVGAVDYPNTPAFGGTLQNEPFSSAGPGKYFFAANGTLLATPQSLGKVNISAPDGGATDVNDTSAGGDNFSSFFGTSAATPAAAAVAALMLQENPNLTPSRIATMLEQTATSFGNPVVAGAGLIDAVAAEIDAAPLRNVKLGVVGNFSGGSDSGIVGENASGTPTIWLMNGSTVTIQVALPTPPSSWHLIATGDFNGDGKSDILWQSIDGTPGIWEMNGTSIVTAAALVNPGPSWHVIGTGDFNGDGKSDILWQSIDGTPGIWEMNGTSIVTAAALVNPGPSWHVIGTGDFNGDGKSDILWQSTDGTPGIWEMNGTSIVTAAALVNPGTSWHVVGTGDFNGDGKSDILWQSTDGTPGIWEMNGTLIVTAAALVNPGTSWHVVGTGDFNGDGKSDILWQSTDGTPGIWEMNGTSIISAVAIGR